MKDKSMRAISFEVSSQGPMYAARIAYLPIHKRQEKEFLFTLFYFMFFSREIILSWINMNRGSLLV